MTNDFFLEAETAYHALDMEEIAILIRELAEESEKGNFVSVRGEHVYSWDDDVKVEWRVCGISPDEISSSHIWTYVDPLEYLYELDQWIEAEQMCQRDREHLQQQQDAFYSIHP